MRVALAVLACAGCLSEPPRAECRVPRPLAELDTGGDETGPWLSPDRLELMFTVGDRTTANTLLMHASRTTPTEPFDDIVEAKGLVPPGTGGVRDAFVEADGLTVWFAIFATSGPGAGERLFRATRDRPGSALFRDPVPVPAAVFGGHPSLTADGLTLFFHRATSGAQQAIHRTRRVALDQEFPPAEPLMQLTPSGASSVTAPSIAGDGARLLFTVAELSGRLQIYEADLKDGELEPGSLEEDVERGEYNDHGASLHDGGESIVFASDRDGDYDLFVACE